MDKYFQTLYHRVLSIYDIKDNVPSHKSSARELVTSLPQFTLPYIDRCQSMADVILIQYNGFDIINVYHPTDDTGEPHSSSFITEQDVQSF